MKKKWTKETIKIEALKYKIRSTFQNNSKGAYLAALRSGILDQVCAHMPKWMDRSGKNSSNFKWTNEYIALEAKKYKTRHEFEKKSENVYQVATKRGLLNEICSHMGEKSNEPWTNEELIIEALKYKTKGEFRRYSPGAYSAASKGDLIISICSHMPIKVIPNGSDIHNFKWTIEAIKNEATKYNTRGKFSKLSCGAYNAARKKGILDQVCSHMNCAGDISEPERNIMNILKLYFPTIKTLKDRNINIPGHSWIKGFDIDCYVKELRKGIEFDGKYHHSFEGLKRGHPTWPDKDIENYHKIKDNYFKSKGIEILHIKEKDWIKDRNKCIAICLEFLGIKSYNKNGNTV